MMRSQFYPSFRKRAAYGPLCLGLVLWAGLLLFRSQAVAQTGTAPLVFKNLALEGGGIRGIAYGGALLELEKRGLLQPIERVAGTSAGAIQACLLAVGYSPQQITDITFETPLQKFTDGRFLFFGDINRMARHYGWYRGDTFTAWLAQLIAQKTGNPDLTFQELHALAGKNGYRDLYITGTNLSMQRTEVFSHETFPHMRVKDAVRISMSVPLFFKAVFMDAQGRVYDKPLPNGGTFVMVDGGLLANFPIMVFDHQRYASSGHLEASPADKEQKTPRYINPETLGIRLDHDDQIAYDAERRGLAPQQIEDLPSYMNAFYRMVLENLNRHELTPSDWDRTVSVSTAGYGPKVRRLSEKDKEKLLASGRAGMLQFFAGCE